MRSIIITLILSIAVFVGTLVITDTYITRKSIAMAEDINNTALDQFQKEIDNDILLTKQSVLNFLSGITAITISNDGNSIIFDEKHLPKFKQKIENNLRKFMKVNKYYGISTFIFDEESNRKYFGGKRGCYAPAIFNGDSTLHNISDHYDFLKSENFQRLKREKKAFWTAPTSKSQVAGKYMTLYVPMLLSDGKFLGAFAVSIDVNVIDNKLKLHLPYDEKSSGIFLVDDKNNLFSAYPQWIHDHKKNVIERGFLSPAEYKKTGYKTFDYNGDTYFIYQRDSLIVPWRIYTVCQSDAVYGGAKEVNLMVLGTSLIGMFLMMICCIVISRKIRKNMRRKAAAEQELKLAANVQQSILKPQKLTTSQPYSINAFMRPAKEAGGDLYDYAEKTQHSLGRVLSQESYLPLKGAEGALIFCIGDVSGKGMPSALFMTQVVSLFRNAVSDTSDPATIVTKINNVLAQNNPAMTFCTFFVGVLNGGSLTFCNAGHNRPVIIPKESNSHFLNVRPNLAIGLMEGYPYKSERIDFAHGDSLLLYTDGITEAKNKNHKEFGDDRLLSAISKSTSDIINSVLSDVHNFVGKYEQSDDITLVLVQ